MSSHFFDLEFTPFTDLRNPQSFPFTERLGFRGSVATFDRQVAPTPPYEQDAAFLASLQFGVMPSGDSDFPIHPFIAPLYTDKEVLTAADVLQALHVSHFRSQHITDLNATTIAYPGYKPRTLNDEIHSDYQYCGIFEGKSDPRSGPHGNILARVYREAMWYVLLHIAPYDHSDGIPISEFVFLFAVGRSLRGPHLIGAISCQFCHNFCD
jgi:hypothetical protein